MIFTVTLNPSLDYIMHTDHLRTGVTNRSAKEELYVGGKGINVSTVLHRLGQPTTILGLIAGFTGDAVQRELERQDIPHRLIRLSSGFSRINVKLKGELETEINAAGPTITDNDFARLLLALGDLRPDDYLVLSGCPPKGLPAECYGALMDVAARVGAQVVVDAAGAQLRQILSRRPYLIKPNGQELSELLETVIDPQDEIGIARLAARLQREGARNILVTLGGSGSLLLDENGGAHVMPAAGGKVINTVGAGDSMIAGFLTGIALGKDMDYALRLGTACGCATAFAPGLATAEEIGNVLTMLPAARRFFL